MPAQVSKPAILCRHNPDWQSKSVFKNPSLEAAWAVHLHGRGAAEAASQEGDALWRDSLHFWPAAPPNPPPPPPHGALNIGVRGTFCARHMLF